MRGFDVGSRERDTEFDWGREGRGPRSGCGCRRRFWRPYLVGKSLKSLHHAQRVGCAQIDMPGLGLFGRELDQRQLGVA